SAQRVPVDEIAWMMAEYRSHHLGWNVKHFHEHCRSGIACGGAICGEGATSHGRLGGTCGAPRGAPAQATPSSIPTTPATAPLFQRRHAERSVHGVEHSTHE